MNALTNLSAQQLRQAAALKERIDALQRQLTRILGGSSADGSNAAFRRRAAAKPGSSMRKSKSSGASAGARPKQHLTAAARARLSAIARARWKKAKAAGRMAL